MSELSLARANALIDLAIARTTEIYGRAICVAVVDERGLLVAFSRMDGSPFRSVQISQGKAYTSARLGATTEAVLARLHREQIEIGYFCDPQLTALPGGSPLKDAQGVMRGAVGVSGLAAAEDQAITDHVAAAFAA